MTSTPRILPQATGVFCLHAFMAAMTLPAPPAHAEDPSCLQYHDDLRLTGSTDIPMNGVRVEVRGNLAYVSGWGNKDNLQVVDISDLDHPVPIGQVEAPFGLSMHFVGNYLYLAEASAGLHVIDVTSPVKPISAGSIQLPSASYLVAPVNDTLIVVAGEDVTRGLTNVHLVSISSPARPVVIGALKIPYGPDYGVVRDNLLYVVTEFDGLFIVDLSHPRDPVVLGSVPIPGYPRDIALVGNTAYIANYLGLQIVDISNPVVPNIVDTIPAPGSPTGLFVHGDRLFVGNYDGILLYDISDSRNPRELGARHLPNYTNDLTVRENHAFLACYGGLEIVEVGNPQPTPALSFLELGYPRNLAISGHLGFISADEGGLRVVDLSDPAHPALIANPLSDRSLTRVRIQGNKAVILERSFPNRILTVDLSDPAQPFIEGAVDLPNAAADFDVAGNYAYVGYAKDGFTRSEYGIQVVDLTRRGAPQLGSQVPTEFDVVNVVAMDGFLYAATVNLPPINEPPEPGASLVVFQIRDGKDVIPVGSLDEDVFSITPVDHALYLGTSSGLKVFDVTRPDTPVERRTLPGITAFSVAASGSMAYVTDGWELSVLNVADPYDPRVVGAVEPRDRASTVATKDGFPVLLGSHGLTVYPAPCGSLPLPDRRLHLFPPAPNPTRSETTVAFDLDSPAETRFQVFDPRGRLVLGRDIGRLPEGHHEVVWDGRNMAGKPQRSGVYFLEIAAGGSKGTTRVTLIR